MVGAGDDVRQRPCLRREFEHRVHPRGDPGDPHPGRAFYDEAARVFDADELARFIALCVTINAWNRIGITCRMSPEQRP